MRAFTLAELLVSLAVMGVLMTGLASALLIVSKSAPDPDSPLTALADGAILVDQIAEELGGATWLLERTATAVTFTVADRDTDGVPERIRYAWSGKPGDALTRKYNDRTAVDVVTDVHSFDLQYDLEAAAEEFPGPPTEGVEEVLSSHDPAKDLDDALLESSRPMIGQYFVPSLPAEAFGWRLSKVRFIAAASVASDSTPELTRVQIRPPQPSGLPQSKVLNQKILNEAVLPVSYVWKEFTFFGMQPVLPGEGLCLVLSHVSGGPSMWYEYDRNDGSGYFWEDSGGVQHFEDKRSLRYYIHGHVILPGPTQTATRQYVTGARITLQATDDPDARAVTATRLLNTPEALSAIWEVDFNADPTIDRNGDSYGDWTHRDANTFKPAQLNAGVWEMPKGESPLDTQPDTDFTKLTTVQVRFRAASDGGNGVAFWINADWSGGLFAPLVAHLKHSSGVQTLTVYTKKDNASRTALVTLPDLPEDFITVRLLIDPDQNIVNVKVDGVEHGTHRYAPFAPPGEDRFASLTTDEADAEIDYVSIRVSE